MGWMDPITCHFSWIELRFRASNLSRWKKEKVRQDGFPQLPTYVRLTSVLLFIHPLFYICFYSMNNIACFFIISNCCRSLLIAFFPPILVLIKVFIEVTCYLPLIPIIWYFVIMHVGVLTLILFVITEIMILLTFPDLIIAFLHTFHVQGLIGGIMLLILSLALSVIFINNNTMILMSCVCFPFSYYM